MFAVSYCFLKSTNLFEVPVNKQFHTENRSCDFDHQKQFIFWLLICFFFSHHELELCLYYSSLWMINVKLYLYCDPQSFSKLILSGSWQKRCWWLIRSLLEHIWRCPLDYENKVSCCINLNSAKITYWFITLQPKELLRKHNRIIYI